MACLFSAPERRIMHLIADQVLPATDSLPRLPSELPVIETIEQLLSAAPREVCLGVRALIHVFDQSARLPRNGGRRFADLSADRRWRHIRSWYDSPTRLRWMPFKLLITLIKLAYYTQDEILEPLGYERGPIAQRAPHPLRTLEARMILADDLDSADLSDVDVCVIGSGAGGAAAASVLAESGFSVLILEEGDLTTTEEFNRRAVDMMVRMYRGAGTTASIAGSAVMIPVGRAVGGSTIINSGTCFRLPERTLKHWRSELGLRELQGEALTPYFEHAERILGVREVTDQLLGGVASVIRRGCERLGFSHGPLIRNVPACEARATCAFGCPSGAKRSTDRSWLPLALSHGARLAYRTRVTKLIVENGRVVGVAAQMRDQDDRIVKSIRLRSRFTIVSCGTLHSPLLLSRSGLGHESGRLGRNLSLHPATKVAALFDEIIDGWKEVPQGYCVDHFSDQGIMFEGAMPPPDYGSIGLPMIGSEHKELMARFGNLAIFGLMVSDSSRGRVIRGPGGEPLILYTINEDDREKLIRGTDILCRIFLAAGARQLYLPFRSLPAISHEGELEQLRRGSIKASEIELAAFHPLGTVAMGSSWRDSVVDTTGALHGTEGIRVLDGSILPSPLGVNPQLTIMAFALRGAERTAEELSARTTRHV